MRGHWGGLLFLFANGFLDFGGIEGVVKPGGEDEEHDHQDGDNVRAGAFGEGEHVGAMRSYPEEGSASNEVTGRADSVAWDSEMVRGAGFEPATPAV